MQGPFLTPAPPSVAPDSPTRVAGIESAGDSADSKSAGDSIFLRPKHRMRDKNLYGESGHENGIGYPLIPRGGGMPCNIHPDDWRDRIRLRNGKKLLDQYNIFDIDDTLFEIFFVNSVVNLVNFFSNARISYSLYPDENVQHDEASDRRQSRFRFTEQQFHSPMSKNEGIKIYTVRL